MINFANSFDTFASFESFKPGPDDSDQSNEQFADFLALAAANNQIPALPAPKNVEQNETSECQADLSSTTNFDLIDLNKALTCCSSDLNANSSENDVVLKDKQNIGEDDLKADLSSANFKVDLGAQTNSVLQNSAIISAPDFQSSQTPSLNWQKISFPTNSIEQITTAPDSSLLSENVSKDQATQIVEANPDDLKEQSIATERLVEPIEKLESASDFSIFSDKLLIGSDKDFTSNKSQAVMDFGRQAGEGKYGEVLIFNETKTQIKFKDNLSIALTNNKNLAVLSETPSFQTALAGARKFDLSEINKTVDAILKSPTNQNFNLKFVDGETALISQAGDQSQIRNAADKSALLNLNAGDAQLVSEFGEKQVASNFAARSSNELSPLFERAGNKKQLNLNDYFLFETATDNKANFKNEIHANAAAAVEPAKVIEQVTEPLLTIAQRAFEEQKPQKLKIKLNPEELGEVEIRLETTADGKLHASLLAKSEVATGVLHQNLSQLQTALENSGWRVDQLNVSLAQTDNQSSSNQQHQHDSQTQTNSDFAAEQSIQETAATDAAPVNKNKIISVRA